jgi:hypothetical protein
MSRTPQLNDEASLHAFFDAAQLESGGNGAAEWVVTIVLLADVLLNVTSSPAPGTVAGGTYGRRQLFANAAIAASRVAS